MKATLYNNFESEKGFLLKILSLLLLMALSLLFSSCGLFFGSNEVDTKSDDYKTYRLDREKAETWKRLKGNDSEQSKTDVAYENPRTGAIISLNSACGDTRIEDLHQLTKGLLLGLAQDAPMNQTDIQVDGQPALQTSFETKNENGTKVRGRVVVLRKEKCTYDLMYIVKPKHFDSLLPYFTKFLEGFHAD